MRVFGQAIGAGVFAAFDREAELQAGDQTLELLLIAPLISADKALHRDARCIGQGQQNAAVRLLDAEIDVVLRLEYRN